VTQPFRLDRRAAHAHVEAINGAEKRALLRTFMPSAPEKPALKVVLCSPLGFCAGVGRAVE
jgi:hypothetical protein